MAYIVSAGERSFRVNAERIEAKPFEEIYDVSLDESRRRVSIARISPSHLSILVDNISYNVEVSRYADGYQVSVRDELFSFRVADEREYVSAGLHEKGEAVVAAPMPGLVVDVLVKQGDEIEARQKLLILEAMKMQNELVSPKSGTIADVHVKPGDSVNTGDRLVVIE
ncbi:biotin/lipoyl-binding protein [Candidatus Fermentibacterales bacterium]|nr:biotin/lipoyl-binding protein [Candidatus Fermentibacterales bacterium]